jgi:hypothetical protein
MHAKRLKQQCISHTRCDRRACRTHTKYQCLHVMRVTSCVCNAWLKTYDSCLTGLVFLEAAAFFGLFAPAQTASASLISSLESP